jgi:2,3-bisphosphoglycerate-independent phosphoglycerate mutase
MGDYSAGHISTPVAAKVISALQDALGDDVIKFYPGVSYRHILTVKNIGAKLKCTPPHDITEQKYEKYLPQCDGDENENNGKNFILSIMARAREIIADMKPEDKGGATDIWLWGQGPAITLPTLKERYGLEGSVISAVDLVRGLGKLAGLTVRTINGATGYLGTNYAGKVDAAITAFDNGEDFVFLHIEAPDETSHEGDLKKKIQAIEEFDKHVVGEMLKYQSKNNNLRIAVTPDHITALRTKTHDASPVPFCICGDGIKADEADRYHEKSSKKYAPAPISGPEFFEMLVAKN